jgi:hypothetical protein
MAATFEQSTRTGDSSFPSIRGHLDIWTQHRFCGWALQGHDPLLVEARQGDKVIACAAADRPRPDLGAVFPNERNSANCGFELQLPPIEADGLFYDIVLSARSIHGADTKEIARVTLPGAAALARALSVSDNDRPVGPFPRDVVNILDALWPGSASGLDEVGRQSEFAGKLLTLLKVPGMQSIEPIVRYVRYLRAIWSHFQFVAAHFPSENHQRDVDAKDFNCRANSPNELMSIAHQLYVLKSYGIKGDFAEFGCFKGFSSSMLSQACAMLDIRMHIFDSFEGLPPSGSSYYDEGDFAGSPEEVTANIEVFGALNAVTLHKGFFSESLKRIALPNLICLWMDVDLEVSAKDLLPAIDNLAPEGTLFSHECSPDIFRDGEILAERSVNNPIPPIVDKFNSLGRPLMGRFVSGNTGAFWSRQRGTGIIANAVLIELVSSL